MLLFLLLAFVWYKQGKRVLSTLTFFGFLTSGYQLIPAEIFAYPISLKPTDYAIVYLVGVIAMEYFAGKRKELIDVLPKFTIIFLLFIAVAAGISIFIHYIPISEVVRNTRSYFLLLTPVLYYTLSKEELQRVLKFLLSITIFTSILYILQPILNIPILQGHYTEGKSEFMGLIEIARFYNTPIYLYFFFFYAFYNTDMSSKNRLISIIIMALPIILCMHRSLLMAIIMVILFNQFREKIKKIYPILIVLIVALIPFFGAIQGNVLDTKIAQDIIGSVEVTPEDFVPGELEGATFTFRVLHFLERIYYASQEWLHLFFGLGFMSEGSDYTINNFDFIVGLENDETAQPSFSFRISYSVIALFPSSPIHLKITLSSLLLIGASIIPFFASGTPSVTAIYSFLMLPFFICSLKTAPDKGFFARSTTPDVSLSSLVITLKVNFSPE